MNRMITIHTETSADADLLFLVLNGEEALSSLYEFNVDVLTENGGVDIKSLLGETMTIELRQTNGLPPRFLSGIVTSIIAAGQYDINNRYYQYRVTLHPELWYLTKNKDCRIWQEKTVPEILITLLQECNILFETKLTWNYRVWEYCVQYQESNFDFISRLMEHEGIYYYFRHEMGRQTLVLVDSAESHVSHMGAEALPCIHVKGSGADIGIYHWTVVDRVESALYQFDDYDFRKPHADLFQARQNPTSFSRNKSDIFEWPGRYNEHSDGEFYVRIRQEELACSQEKMSGESNALTLSPGWVTSVSRADREEDNRAYLITSAEYLFTEAPYNSTQQGALPEYKTRFTAHPSGCHWRPARKTPWPRTYGPQTAVVVCPEGSVVRTDKYGRVKLRFHWDHHSSQGDTSCWVRVSSAWAGAGYGAIQVPRAGEEVIVDFINGEPDRPIVTGRVYNAANMPPWELPAGATKMGVMTRSKEGMRDNGSYLVFDDAPGQESLDMHAERDMNLTAEKDLTKKIEGNEKESIGGDWTKNVNGKVLIASERDDITIKSPTQVNIEAPKYSITIKGHTESITGQSFSMTGNSQSITGCSVGLTQFSVSLNNLSINYNGLSIDSSMLKLNKSKTKIVKAEDYIKISNVSSIFSSLLSIS
ncbi:type VI secretion system Vgr family protein [Serratia marcescens]|uniref:type VI secretion system Vgr family protein n=1 Tax=Serratia marcescens TaxID=615 RepID=UPI0002B88386|nr:type VI secretion system tip protein TssI/VgrG [Serratia marcescens]EMF07319.1 VgrG protein [Serratia marcescens VGH107]